jgi:DNA mismatch endonuclease (patch repair protein)
MQGNRGRGTWPESLTRRALRKVGAVGYRLNWRTPAGRADIAFPGRRIAILVHGCFWHGCPRHSSTPKSHSGFWKAKFKANKARDRRVRQDLSASGWLSLELWECDILVDPDAAIRPVLVALRNNRLLK